MVLAALLHLCTPLAWVSTAKCVEDGRCTYGGQHPPVVAREIAEREEKGTLPDWKIDVQEFARRRWRTLKDEQIPRLKEESEIMQKRIVALFKCATVVLNFRSILG